MALLKSKKAEFRQIIQSTLKKLDEKEIVTQSSIICNAVISTPEYQAASNVGIYLSMPTGEVLTDGIVRHALKAGKKVYVPYLYNKRVEGENKLLPTMDMASLHSEDDYDSLLPDKWGIPSLEQSSLAQRMRCLEGNLNSASTHLEVMLVPGVAFDFTMGRLGHGKGYYDRFIAAYRAEKLQSHHNTMLSEYGDADRPVLVKPRLFGLALDEQMLAQGHYVPAELSDFRMDAVFIGNGKMILPPSSG